jgi:hypothetical protein
MIIASIAADKLRVWQGQPNRITADIGGAAALMTQFREMGRAYREGKVIPGELSTAPAEPNPLNPKD